MPRSLFSMSIVSKLKRASLNLAIITLVGLSSASVAIAADTIGFVNYQKLVASFGKAQVFNDDMKSKEADLEKTRAEYMKQIREAKSEKVNNPVSTEKLQKELETSLKAQIQSYRTERATRAKALESEMDSAIQGIAEAKNLSVILSKDVVFSGGVDITNDVLLKLNNTQL
ncbi:MAG: OmpH family outer membrane protein [Cyanobacteria bacterium P01_H01_bin.74]